MSYQVGAGADQIPKPQILNRKQCVPIKYQLSLSGNQNDEFSWSVLTLGLVPRGTDRLRFSGKALNQSKLEIMRKEHNVEAKRSWCFLWLEGDHDVQDSVVCAVASGDSRMTGPNRYWKFLCVACRVNQK